MRWTLLWCALGIAALAGCTHLKGVVLEDSAKRPLRTAIITVGRPTGIAVYETHRVNADGTFDFYISPTDENHVYLYDSARSPDQTMRRIDPMEMSDHMTLRIRPSAPETLMLPAGPTNYP